MKVASAASVKANFDRFLQASAEEAILVTRKGKPLALLVGIDDADDVERLRLAFNPKFQKMLAEAEREIREGKVISHEALWQEMERRFPNEFARKKPRRRTG